MSKLEWGCLNRTNIPHGNQFKLSKLFTTISFNRAYPVLTGNLCLKQLDECRCKGKANMHPKPFSIINALWPWPFDPEPCKAHPQIMGSLCVKFHDYRCENKAIMPHKPFSVITALWPWPFDPKTYRAHPQLMGSLRMKFHDDRCKGKAIMQQKAISVINALWPWPLTFWTQNP